MFAVLWVASWRDGKAQTPDLVKNLATQEAHSSVGSQSRVPRKPIETDQQEMQLKHAHRTGRIRHCLLPVSNSLVRVSDSMAIAWQLHGNIG